MEKSYKRTEDAAIYLKRIVEKGIAADYLESDVLGKDAHTVTSIVNDVYEFITCI